MEIRPCLSANHFATHSYRGNLILLRYRSGKICCLNRMSHNTGSALSILFRGKKYSKTDCAENEGRVPYMSNFNFSSKPCSVHTKYAFLSFNELSSFLLCSVFSSFICKHCNNKHCITSS